MAVRPFNTKSTYLFDVEAKTSSGSLTSLISSGKACYAVHIECSRTRYRHAFKFQSESHKFHVPANLIDGKVQVSRFVLAEEDIVAYTNKNFNHVFNGFSFSIKKGDILALDAPMTFDADKEIDALKSIPSIFRIKVSPAEDAPPMEVDFDSNKINIYLSKENFRRFKTLQFVQSLHPVLAQMVIVPTLISVLEKIKSVSEDENAKIEYDDLKWYKVLSRRLKELGIEVDGRGWTLSTVAVAQKLIADPVSLSLEALEMMEVD